MVLNVPNQGAVPELERDDVIEIPCVVDQSGAHQIPVGPLPLAVRGLTIAVKAYERLTIRAAMRNERALADLALFTNPMVGDWEAAQEFMNRLFARDPVSVG